MKMFLFSSKDLKTQCFMNPQVAIHSGAVIRGFTDAVNKPSDSDIYNHPDDFELYEVAEFDPDTGRVTGYSDPKLICQGSTVKVR